MREFFTGLLDSSMYSSRNFCAKLEPGVALMHNVSDGLIWGAYIAIPIILIYFALKRRGELPFYPMFWMFGAFIVLCGFTHFMEIVTFYNPVYRLSGLVKAATAVVSWATAFAFIPITPRALAMRFPEELEAEIAERKRVEEALLASNERLASANLELESFAYSVSHDLRAPLRGIDGFARILEENHSGELSRDAQRYLHLVRQNTERMNALINDLLMLSRFGREPINRAAVNMGALAREVVNELAHEREGRNVEITMGDLPGCEADASLLKQVFMNLIGNAQKFSAMRDPARIEVGWSDGDDNQPPHYFVRDNGVGFDMEYVDKLFGVFQRLHAQDEFRGTGVGLAIVARAVEKHGGVVWATAAVDQGATFRFTLPPQ